MTGNGQTDELMPVAIYTHTHGLTVLDNRHCIIQCALFRGGVALPSIRYSVETTMISRNVMSAGRRRFIHQNVKFLTRHV